MKLQRALITFVLFFLAGTAGHAAQSTAQISGAVTDQTGAVLPGVEISATQTDTGLNRNAVTDETGSYTLTNLPIGPYRLEAALPGFKTYVQTGIVLQVSSNPVVNAVLEVGQVADQIEVQADAALVETRTTGVGQMIDNQRVLELPLNGRQVTELVLLSGAANTYVDSRLASNRNYPTIIITVAGGLSTGLAYVLDGATHNDPLNNLNLPLPFPDALQEFKVETSALPAQYGHHSAAAVNAVTKAGTNEFHGSLFEFVRNGSLNARNAFALTNDGLKRNQFGGTIGGPIARNKLFFFAGFQGTTLRSKPTDNRQFIPTPAMLAGDFTTVASAACNSGRQINLALPFVGNRVDPGLFSNPSLNVVKRLPATTDPCGEIRFGRRTGNDEKLTVGRMDYQWSDKHSLFGRYMEARLDTPTDYDTENILTLSVPNQTQRVYSFVLGDTYLIGANTVNTFRGTLNRVKNDKYPPPFFDLAELGVKDVYVRFPKYMSISVTNGFNFPGSQPNPGHYNTTSFQFTNDISRVSGSHQVGFGGSFIHGNLNANSGVNVNGNTFNGQVTGMGLADFLLGRMSNFQQGSENVSNPRQNYFGAYIQDTWKTTSKLTINAGVRWEPFRSGYDAHGQTVHFDQAAFDKGQRSSVYKNAPAGLLFPGDPGVDENAYFANRWLQFAPRVGFAWDPQANGRMAVRAAYGIFFDSPNLWTYSGVGSSAPYGNLVSIPNPTGGFENPWQGYPGGNPFPLYTNPNIAFPSYVAYVNFRPEMQLPYSHQWNLSVQRQLGTNWMVSANYLGNSTIHLFGSVESNPAVYLPGASCVIAGRTYTPCSSTANINQRRALSLQNPDQGQYYAFVTEVEDGGTANYHGLLLSVQRRRSNGLTVQGNYTWSHCIGDELVPFAASARGAVNPGLRSFLRGNCASDLRHVANLSTVYETPQFANAALRVLGSGWQISGIVRLQAGSYLTVSSGVDTALNASAGNDRANQVLGDPYTSNKTVDQWLNPAAFARPANGQYGNASKNIQGPGSIAINMGLTRKFQIRENHSLEFRAEAFNAPNHVNPGNPITTLSSQNFGKIQSASDPRIIQLALKYVF